MGKGQLKTDEDEKIIVTSIYQVLCYILGSGLSTWFFFFFCLGSWHGGLSSELEHSRGRLDILSLSLGIQMWILPLCSGAGIQVCILAKQNGILCKPLFSELSLNFLYVQAFCLNIEKLNYPCSISLVTLKVLKSVLDQESPIKNILHCIQTYTLYMLTK